MKQAMIFAAGLGTRLKPLTDTMPKALVPVAGKPLLGHVIERLRAFGAERIVINIHHFGQQIIDYLDRHEHFGLDIRISDERQALLDTGGGIKKARPLFDPSSPILIHNVDILSDADLEAIYASAQTAFGDTPTENHHPNPAIAFGDSQAENHRPNLAIAFGDSVAEAVLLASPRKTSRYLLFGPDRRLVGWQNITTGELRGPIASCPAESFQTNAPLRLAFSGIHVFNPSLFPLMDAWPDKFSIIDFYLNTCASHTILGYPAPELRLMDVGKLDTLAEADTFVQSLNS